MEGLRWILLLIGLLILGGIYYFGSGRGRPRLLGRSGDGRDSMRRDTAVDTTMERELERLAALISEDREGFQAAPARDEASALASDPEKIVALYLRSHGAGLLGGREISEAAEKVGLSFGDRSVYHRMQDREDAPAAIFSLANITNPGGFEPARLDQLQTHGLCLFLTLPNYFGALDAWDAMLATGRRLADLLDVELLDETQSSLSRQRVAHIREQMREYDRQREVRGPGSS